MAVVEGCPAFSGGCPFSKLLTSDQYAANAIPEVLASLPKELTEKCPAFKDGCPFKAENSVEALYNHMAEMPASHRLGESGSASVALARTLQLVHEKSKEMKGRLSGATCPVFATSCPFKTLTSAGEPLVEELDVYIDRWGLADVGEEALGQAAAPMTSGSTPSTLSKSLKAGTKSVHRAAENVRFVREFLKGAVPLQSYVEFLRDLYHVYNALETAIDALPAEFRHCDFEALRRTSSLAEDLRRFTGVSSGEELDVGKASPAAMQYADRLQHLMKHSPTLVLAHAYTRYLGDLSGGQILARAAAKAYDLPEGEGTAFYRFENIGVDAADIKAFKRSYRASLDALRLSAVEADAMVAEANNAFLMNILVFEERDVAAGHLDRVHRLDELADITKLSALKFQQAYGTEALKKASGKCPFLPAVAQTQGGQPTTMSERVCPWPYVWLHDPKAALVVHPAKNAGAVIGLCGFAQVAWRYPRTSATCLLAFGTFSWWLKPRKHKMTSVERS